MNQCSQKINTLYRHHHYSPTELNSLLAVFKINTISHVTTPVVTNHHTCVLGTSLPNATVSHEVLSDGANPNFHGPKYRLWAGLELVNPATCFCVPELATNGDA